MRRAAARAITAQRGTGPAARARSAVAASSRVAAAPHAATSRGTWEPGQPHRPSGTAAERVVRPQLVPLRPSLPVEDFDDLFHLPRLDRRREPRRGDNPVGHWVHHHLRLAVLPQFGVG